jgi:hypothetical protein
MSSVDVSFLKESGLVSGDKSFGHLKPTPNCNLLSFTNRTELLDYNVIFEADKVKSEMLLLICAVKFIIRFNFGAKPDDIGLKIIFNGSKYAYAVDNMVEAEAKSLHNGLITHLNVIDGLVYLMAGSNLSHLLDGLELELEL